jgi:hypothetical protein
MGRVYNDWRTIPDDPNRVGDEDEDYKWRSHEVDPDEEREREWDRHVRDNN